jgi:hypothetical protein
MVRMDCAGRGDRKDRTGNGENGLCGEGGSGGIGKTEQGMVRMDCAGRGDRKGRTGNGNGRTRNDSLPLTVLISGTIFFSNLSFAQVSNKLKDIFEEILTIGRDGLWIPNSYDNWT